MSTAELQRYIDERTAEERAFIADYLRYLNRPRAKNIVEADAETAAKMKRISDDYAAGRNFITEEECDRRMAELDRQGR